MTNPPKLTDRSALTLHRARAAKRFEPFLHAEAAFEIEERLSEVKRAFTKPAIVCGHRAGPLAELLPGAKRVEDTEVLDLEVGAHDLVVHALGLHWADDPLGQIIQCARALEPDGLFLAVSFGGETLIELRQSLAAAETRLLGGLSPRVAPMAELRDLGGLLGRAGLQLPVADRSPRNVRYASLIRLMSDLRHMGETNALQDRHRKTPPKALFPLAANHYAEHFADGDGLRATFEFLFLTGWSPGPNQPQPLRPGSATTRLADALNTQETPVPRDEDTRGV